MLAGAHLSSLSTTLLAPGSREPGSSRGKDKDNQGDADLLY